MRARKLTLQCLDALRSMSSVSITGVEGSCEEYAIRKAEVNSEVF